MSKILFYGDKNTLALEVVESSNEANLGFIFLYVNNFKYGYESHPYEIETALQNVIDYFKAIDFGTRKLIDCPSNTLFAAFDTCFNEEIDFSELDSDAINKLVRDEVNDYYPDFYQQFLSDDELDSCYFRLGNYMFDGISLITIPKDERLRLYIRDDSSGTGTDIETTRNQFLGLWKELLEQWKSN